MKYLYFLTLILFFLIGCSPSALWQYKAGEKGFLCNDKGCFVGQDVNDYVDTEAWGRLYWTGLEHFWQPEPIPNAPLGKEIH